MTNVSYRATFHEARRHFLDGGRVLVSERGHEPTCPVTSSTTTHVGGPVEWDELVASMRMWRGRYPGQRFYIIRESA